MRSFLNIFSKKAEYSSIQSFEEAVGLDSELRTRASDIGNSSSSAFLAFDKLSDSNESSKCFIDSERYFIQHDIRVYSDGENSNSIGELFDTKSIEHILSNPGKINDLPIRDFHLLIWDKYEAKLLVFRDQIGIWPLYYYSDDSWLVISTDILLIRSLRALNLVISEDWIAESLVNLQSAHDQTFYTNINLIAPGNVFYSDLKQEKTATYYNLIEALDPGKYPFEEANEIFEHKLEDAFKRRLKGFSSTGSELSGGLDSSAIVSLAYPIAQIRGMEFHTFSNVLPKDHGSGRIDGQDESFFGSMLINELNISNHHALFGQGKGIISELKSHLKTMGMSTQQLFTMFSDEIFEKVASLKIPMLLSGFGGDEGVSCKSSGFFEEMALERNWDVFLREMRINYELQNKHFAKGYSKYLVERYLPFGSDLSFELKKRKHWKWQKIKGFGYDQDFGQRMNIRSRYLKGKGYSIESRMMDRQYRRLTHPYISRRLIGSYQIGLKYGFSYTFPLLDRDLLEFHLSLPATYKYRNGTDRILLRESLKGKVPEAIRLRNDKQGAVVPSVYKRLLKDENSIRLLIKRSQQNNRYHYLDYNKLVNWLELLVRRDNRQRIYHNPNAFYNSLQILLLQEMERTGEYKTGILY